MNLAYDHESDTILVEVACVTHRLHCAEPSAAREVYEALQRLVEERDALRWRLQRAHQAVEQLRHEVES